MLIPIYRVISSQFPVDTTTGNIEMGMVVGLETNTSNVTAIRRCQATGGADTDGVANQPLGLAGDRKRASEAYEWVNRVSDSGDETSASSKMTVYHGGGEFWVDVDDSAITTPGGTAIRGVIAASASITVGAKLYPVVHNGTTLFSGQLIHTQTSSDDAVARVLSDAVTVDSGIPGEYEPGSSVGYADPSVPRTWVQIKLLV